MKIDRVLYQKVFPLGRFDNEKIGFEASIDDVENPMEAISKLRELAEETFNAAYPTGLTGTHERVIEETTNPPESRVQSIIQDISTCKELKVLESYRLIANSNPLIQEAYNNKLKQFQ